MVKRFRKEYKIKNNIDPKPFHLLITGDGGVGKSHLIKTIYMSLNKVMMYKAVDPEKPRI